MILLGHDIAPLGMGCWPIGGPMFDGNTPLGYSGSDDATSRRTIHAALDSGITLFDTAAAYGAGHAERLLGETLKDRPDAMIITKIGLGIDEATKQITGPETAPETVLPAIDAALTRLQRDRIDVVLLHVNELPVAEALPIFDQMEAARQTGKIRSYGWSTDFTDSAAAISDREGVVGIEHAMHVMHDAARLQAHIEQAGLVAFLRSPLAMGLLSGKYDATTVMPANDIRATDQSWLGYYKDGRPDPAFLAKLGAVRELLRTGGRTLVQGAIGWLWAKSDRNIPLPGAKSVTQIEGIAGALTHGPLPRDVMAEIEALIPRDPDAPDTQK